MLSREDFENFVNKFEEGIITDIGTIKLKKLSQGRFIEEFNLDLEVNGESLLTLKVFLGRYPYWNPWIEVFGIKPRIKGKDFWNSEAEREVYNIISRYFPKVFVEYFEDKETAKELQKGVPPALSRLGFELLKRGYTYFRDWYIPEGLMEGGHKIQAEKPLNEEIMKKHIKKLQEEYREFIQKCTDENLKKKIEKRYLEYNLITNG
ncbi:MAG: DUF1122 domain-containing protein [Aquifex sp.]|nr:MAG: DUF1122 domain-containing protein [Aquifex sp.]